MTKEEKELLIKDICGRLRYGVKAKVYGWDEEKGEVEISLKIYSISTDGYVRFEANDYDVNYLAVDDCLLYLRPMSSMTEEERMEFTKLFDKWHDDELFDYIEEGVEFSIWKHKGISPVVFDWLNSHHFDYRSLIDRSLALEATEGMYDNIKTE